MAHRGFDADRSVRSRTRGGADKGGGRLAKGDETGGGGIAVLTILGIIFFLVVVAILVRTPDNDNEVRTAGPPVTSSASVSQPAPDPAPVVAPVGAVATGGGGTADSAGSLALPVIAGLAALTLVVGSVVVRRIRLQAT